MVPVFLSVDPQRDGVEQVRPLGCRHCSCLGAGGGSWRGISGCAAVVAVSSPRPAAHALGPCQTSITYTHLYHVTWIPAPRPGS